MTTHTVTTHKTWFERLGKSFAGIIVGILLFLGGTVLLWWNEGNFVKTQAALKEAQSVTQELGDVNTVDDSLNGKLVHATGEASTEDILEDSLFGISANAIRLERSVEFYQWEETKKTETKQKLGGGEETVTTYTYSQEWVDKPVDSNQFGAAGAPSQYKNTILLKLEHLTVLAKNVSFGAYNLPEFLVTQIKSPESLSVELSEETLGTLKNQLPPSDSPTSNGRVHVSGSTVYLGNSPSSPENGDVRVSFKRTQPKIDISLVAQLYGSTFEPYRAKNGRTVSLLSIGAHSTESMFDDAHAANTIVTWILRIVGVFCICIGLLLVTAPLSVLASVIPLLGTLVGAGTGIFCVLFGGAWSLLIIATAWLFYRPLIGIIALAAAAGLIALLYRKRRTVEETKTPE